MIRILATDLDSGPNWIHGNVDNPISTIAKQTGTVIDGADDDDNDTARERLFDSNGNPVPFERSSRLSAKFWDLVVDAFQYSNDHSANIPKTKSLLDYIKQTLQDSSLSGPDKEMVEQIAYMWGCFVGDSIEKQSLKFFFLEECVEGGMEPDSAFEDLLSSVQETSTSQVLTRRYLKRSLRHR